MMEFSQLCRIRLPQNPTQKLGYVTHSAPRLRIYEERKSRTSADVFAKELDPKYRESLMTKQPKLSVEKNE